MLGSPSPSDIVTASLARLTAALADRYRVERELGRGGMATVFLAQDVRHDRPVALKVLKPELAYALGPDRFLREVRITARLNHPHILPLLDSGETEGLLYYVMPYVDGESLRDRLKRDKQLPLDDALQMAREVADALSYAHRHDVVHRDIKPENILLESGHAVVADFGIARAITAASEEKLTETGLAIGTPAYMSPEQAAGETTLDGRSDLYSLGCVLYEMLAGEPPFTGLTAQAVLVRRLTEPHRPLRTIRETIPQFVDQVVTKALAKIPADRYATAAQFAVALTAAATATATPTRTAPVATPPAQLRNRFARFLGRPLFAALILGILIGGGALFAAWWKHGSGGSGLKRLAVLPFENLGDSADAYFADGMTDAVRGKLSTLLGLQVTGRGSSTPYRNTTKTPQQIGEELGVQYLLTGTVRWDKRAGATNRVQVSPELIQVETGASKWQVPFDAPLTDVFQVQGDIAGRVAQALNVALGDSVRQRLVERPTQNLAAYDAFLRGEAASQGLGAIDPVSLQRAIGYYEQAVLLDSTFIEAWAQLSRASSQRFFTGATRSPAAGLRAREAAERALALRPGRPEGHLALADYYSYVANEGAPALASAVEAQRRAPASADLLLALARAEQSLSRWSAALDHLERARALDPRSVLVARRLGLGLLWLRRYAEAGAAADRGLALAPANFALLNQKAMSAAGEGDLPGVRAALTAVPPEVEPMAFVAWVANTWHNGWMLDASRQALLLRLGPSAFDGSRGNWGLALANISYLRGDSSRARAYGDSAQHGYADQIRVAPEDGFLHGMRGMALAYAGRKAEAVTEGERGTALLPMSRDAYAGIELRHFLARIYTVVGEQDKAVDRLEELLRVPHVISAAWLRIDPNFAPLRSNPRFQKLVARS